MFKKTDPFARVEKAIGVFRQAVDELTAAAELHKVGAERHETAAIIASAENVRHTAAAANATKTANKIAELVW